MSLSMYEASVPALSRMLDNLRGILEKALRTPSNTSSTRAA